MASVGEDERTAILARMQRFIVSVRKEVEMLKALMPRRKRVAQSNPEYKYLNHNEPEDDFNDIDPADYERIHEIALRLFEHRDEKHQKPFFKRLVAILGKCEQGTISEVAWDCVCAYNAEQLRRCDFNKVTYTM